jgi:hypothetical protein
MLVSPFISLNIAEKLIDRVKNKQVQLLTRFNLADFKSGVSSITALENLYHSGFEIRGLAKLHAKTYLFDSKSIISTSANLTSGGFYGNFEHGVLYNDPLTIESSYDHFLNLWSYGNPLSAEAMSEWKEILKMSPSIPNLQFSLGDFGGVYKSDIVYCQTFIKWLGTGNDRASLDTEVLDVVAGSGCDYAVCFSHHPIRYRGGDQVFISIMTDTFDYAIFGRAKAYVHDRQNDVASESEIAVINWKKDWPYYIRLYDVEFLEGVLQNCPMLYRDIVDKLDYDSFQSTQDRHMSGELHIITKRSLKQKQDVRLTSLASILLNDEFEKHKMKKL